MTVKNEAQKQNPALKSFTALIGEWSTEGTHPYVPGKTFHGRTIFEWIEGGAFLLMRSQIDEPEIPSGVAIFGSDNVTKEYFMLYFDERDISRKYDVSFKDGTITWSRNSADFSQEMKLTVFDDGNTIISKGKMSKDGGAWEPDLELTYTRKK
jgi:hypothetical protein